MTERGFIALYRGYFDHDFFKQEPLTEREAFQWLIMEACWEPKTVRIDGVKVTLQRGDLAHSLRFLAEAWGPEAWDLSRVRRFIVRLESEGMISRNTFETPNGTQLKHQTQRLTICNYDKFQSLRSAYETPNDTPELPKTTQSKPSNHLTKNTTPPVPTPEAVLAEVLDAERASAVVDHRRKLRKPLTVHAAKLLAGKFARAADPNAAAETMIVNGWQGYEVEWEANRRQPRVTGPPQGKRTITDAALDWIASDDHGQTNENSDYGNVKFLPAARGQS